MGSARVWGSVGVLALTAMAAAPSMQSGPAAKPAPPTTAPAAPLPPKLADYKKEAATSIDGMYDRTQQMIDTVFSFGELGFQEFETARYLTTILEKEGFTIEKGVAGIPTAWTARY